jgi:serine/threonine protein kinase
MAWSWFQKFVQKKPASPAHPATANGVRPVPPQPARPLPRVLKPGDRIGGEFRVLNAWKGGMGAVYLVAHQELSEPIVVKTLLDPSNENARKLFVKETETWIKLGFHPNIVQAFWIRTLEDDLYVAAEYVNSANGPNTLDGYIKRGNVSNELVVRWVAEFCYGMNYAVANGIKAHRDIKPANLMVDETQSLRITDFGLAKTHTISDSSSLDPSFAEAMSGVTATGAGTPVYMPPEQFDPRNSVDQRADIYSFGATLFHLCTGTVPFAAASIPGLMLMHLKTPVPSTNSVFDHLIKKCMAKRPEDRYQSFDQLHDAILPIAQRLGVQLKAPKLSDNVDLINLFNQALSLSAIQQPAQAMAAISKYIERASDDFRGWTLKGRLHLEAGEVQAALDSTSRSIKLNSFSSKSWNNMGLIQNRLKNYEDAVRAYERAIKLEPNNTGAMLNCASTLSTLRRYDEAEQMIEKALRIHPEKASLWHNLGAILLDRSDKKDAIAAFEKALLLNPNSKLTKDALEEAKATKSKTRSLLWCGGCGVAFFVDDSHPIHQFTLRGVPRLFCACCREWVGKNVDPNIPKVLKGYDDEGQDLNLKFAGESPSEKRKRRMGQPALVTKLRTEADRNGQKLPPIIFSED